MRRPAHGATTRPPLARPGSGFGRPLRPGPPPGGWAEGASALARLEDPISLLLGVPGDAEHLLIDLGDAALSS